MKLSRKGEYACLAMLDLAEHYGEGYVKTADICQRKGIPKSYLEQILLILQRSRYVRSARGMDGGHQLTKPPSDISVAEIVRLIDGPLAPVDSASEYFYEPTPIEKSPGFLKLFKEIRNYISSKLEQTTFADLLE
ncbi:transcriptional regulator, BadM/Rrf2 family [Candidatus Vecturithrix granuli]|uniref:Transcriptional regulator, BadM/Rrf2 family n=1 Tax=Vecturithrix granuli TaxID=1499967 RepID=A0A081BU68_VECG1|nr:transcriptional regulator, BadM/Rrf2 family [Candidatus Vecturithrix granuli]